MKISSKRIARKRSQKIAACAVIGLFVAVLAIPSLAVARDDRDWRGHERHAHWGHPGYVYAPPVVYAPPPPVESPGLNLIIPFNFR